MKKTTSEQTALTEIKSYAVLAHDPAQLREIMTANIGGGGLSEFDLDRVKVPAGGGLTWEIPGLEGESSRTIEGVIVAWRDVRAYWSGTFEAGGGGNPPDCASPDGVRGAGNPGGECAACPLARFGSMTRDGKATRSQACKAMRLLFVVREADMLPLVVVAPPSSLGPLRKYFLRLASKGIPYYGVVTSLGLERDKSRDGIQYSAMVPVMSEQLPMEQVARMRAYSESIAPLVNRVSVEQPATD